MPELPEVETIRRALARHLVGRRVAAVEVGPKPLRRPLGQPLLTLALTGHTLLEPRRRGKFLLLDRAGGGSLLVHLGMSGRLQLAACGRPRPPHTHLVLRLDSDLELRLVDPRRFGLASWLAAGAEAVDPSLRQLGLEPLDPGLPAALPRLLAGRRAAVKTLLLDQRLVAGVGNIYASEALWRAGVRPTRPGGFISRDRVARLAGAVQQVLADAVEAGGTTLRDFSDPLGEPGLFAVRLDVYGRAGEPCPSCAAPVRRSLVGGRSTFWCARCQR